LYDHTKGGIPELNDVELLKIGRHFRLSKDTKLIVGRNKMENEILESLILDDDIIIEASNYVGPTCLLRTQKQVVEKEIEIAASIALRYSDSPKEKSSKVKIKKVNEEKEDDIKIEKEIITIPIDLPTLDTLRI
jgi:predicted ribosome quality control (RQC) complex YloA/Tae2 family protein